ncbi:S-layer homology domain-containing protein [Paenibacillus segetis]|nr:S-layer homology domain-containing protein [Paenibacillus segetis]
MKKMMFALCLILLSSSLFTFGSTNVKAATGSQITLSSNSNSVRVGDTVKVQVNGEQFTDLFGAEVTLTYEPQALQVLEVKEGDAYDDFGAYVNHVDMGELYIPLVRKQLLVNQQSTVRLVEITFRALKEKDTVVEVTRVKAVSSERLTNTQGYKDLKVLTSDLGAGLTIKIAKQIDKAPDSGSGSGQTGSNIAPSPSKNMKQETDALLQEKDPLRAAGKLQSLLNGLNSEPNSADKDVLLKTAGTILDGISQVPVTKEGSGTNETYVITSDDVNTRNALIQGIKESLSKLNMKLPEIEQTNLRAFMGYSLDGRDVNKLGVYRLNEDTGAWEYIWGAIHQAQTNEFTIGVQQAGTYRVMEFIKKYEDTTEIYAEARYATEVLTAKHILNGTSESIFSPSKQVTRAEFASMIVRALLQDQVVTSSGGGATYSDVRTNEWYYGYVETLQQLQIINGFGDGTFRPNDPVTREQMVVIVMKALESLGLAPADNMQTTGEQFEDDQAISGWAKESVISARGMNIVSGTGQNQFVPKQSSNRADTAVFIWKMLQYAK